MENSKKAWSIQALQVALDRDLMQCHTQTERDCCNAIGGREIRELAISEYSKRGKLNPAALAIAERYGFRVPSDEV